MPRSFRLPLLVVLTIALTMAGFSPAAVRAQDGADVVRGRIQSRRAELLSTERERVLRQAAADVARAAVEELKSRLTTAEQRASADATAVLALQQQASALATEIANLETALPQHEAADQLVALASASTGRVQSLIAARQRLEQQLSELRKSSVEWRSKAADADQQLTALTASRAALDKSAADAKSALDAADAAIIAAQSVEATAKAARDTLAVELQKAEEQVASAKLSMDRIANSTASLERSLATLTNAAKLTGVDASAATQGLEKAIADFVPIRASVESLAAKVTALRDEQSARMATASTELDKATTAVVAAVTAAEPARAAWQTASAAVTAAIAQQGTLETVRADGVKWQSILNAQQTSLAPSVAKLSAEILLADADALLASRQAEAALEPLGRFVSYSRDVAPIFARRCVACHNTRSAGGRLNLDSFSSLLKGGESGATLDPHHSASSLMVMMMEDGSMPKESDPVTPEELAIVKRWIEVGAPLDAGLSATADLFAVMPELAQPLPPTEYRVAIPVTAVAFSPDGSQLASSGYHEILVWNTADGSLVRRITNVAERIYDLEYSPDGQSLAVAAGTPGQLGELKLFTATDGRLIRTLVRARDAVFAVSFSPDGSQLACGGADRSIMVVRAVDGEIVQHIEDHADWVMDVSWSPNGQRLVSSSRDKSCKVFEAATGSPVITFSGHGEPVYAAAFLADNLTVVSGGSDRKLRVWNTADAKEARAIGGFGGDIFRLQVLPGDQILSASGDRNLHQHNAADGTELRQLAGHGDWVYTLSVHAGTKRIASGSYDGEIRIWNADDGSMTTSFIAIPKTMPDQSVAASVE